MRHSEGPARLGEALRVELERAVRLRGEITPPPDKSVSHRAVMLSSIAKGRSRIRNFLRAADTMSTLNAFRALGVEIRDDGEITIEGTGLYGLKEPLNVMDCGNSGTTMRLISGILSGNPFFSVLTGDDSLRGRPMGRIIAPLRAMGAEIGARQDRFPPLSIKGGKLKPIKYEMPVSSAQVKSAVLLAGLYADGTTEVKEAVKSRDHTERMLPAFGADIEVEGLTVRVKGGRELRGIDVAVPGDFSSAAFFLAASAVVKDSEILIRNVGLNPTRTGFLDVLREMGAEIEIQKAEEVSGEPSGDIYLKGGGNLKGIMITEDRIPSMIDEFPALCVVASLAEGVTDIGGAGELRVKESDRIRAMAEGLRKMGVEVQERPDGMSIKGKASLKGAEIESHGDHRIAMALSVAALAASGKTVIEGAEAVDISFPGFFETLKGLARG